MVVAVAKPVCQAAPGDAAAWIHWAYALRELNRVEEARDVLIKAEPLHAEANPVIHYNLACYYSLLGEIEEAKRRLSIACKADETCRKTGIDDPDLRALWDSFAPDSP
jgi:Flp pilus assembly protein TadD